MSAIPRGQDENLRKLIEEYAEVLKTESHKLGAHGLNQKDFYRGGLFRGAIARVRGRKHGVRFAGGRVAVIELNGCLQGNNAHVSAEIVSRQQQVDGLIVWRTLRGNGGVVRESALTAVRRS